MADVAETYSAGPVRTEIFRPVQTQQPFSSLVVCADMASFPSGSLQLEAQVCMDGAWSKFYQLGYFSPAENKSFPAQADDTGRVTVDELQLSRPAQQYRLRVLSADCATWRQIAVCGVHAPFIYREESARMPVGSFAFPISPISQKEYPSPDKDRICSPTSLCMALNALGNALTLSHVVQGVYDPAANIYGNWILNTAYAARQGVEAYVRRFGALAELAEFCTEKSLVIASVSYGENELPGSPQPQTPGHLVLIRGWQGGKILVADPAAPAAADVLRAYEAKAFAQAWLKNKQGAAYIVRKL